MKRLVILLVVLFTATTLLAGGKECNLNKSAKSVELTGTVAKIGSGDEAKTVFRVANGKSYTVCHESKADVLGVSKDGATVKVKGKLMNCGEEGGETLVISEAKRV
ncbi:MAG TPA: hypothetical protein VEK11_03655 [Thermoanaerobaculia bacterium]|jgi:hypothetical protein|nr:hypothetical protein [Thermoanaerobaculia bacterium]